MNTESEPIPALSFRSKYYPERYGGRVPRRVRIVARHGVCPDFPMALFHENKGLVCPTGDEFEAWTNSHGAVSAIFPDGRQLGLKPDEFEVIDWYTEQQGRTA